MESNIDIKELWNRQTVPAADQSAFSIFRMMDT